MKWSDLTLKERKQIYDAVRAENPNASYFDIKSQFDSIPGYEDGKYTPSPHIIDFIIKREGFIPSPIIPKGDSKLTVGYGFTDPYIINKYKNQEITRLEADSILTEELEKGNYGNAAVSTLMNAIPWGVGKGLRKIKSRVSNTLNTPIEIHSSMVDEYPSILAEKARSKTSKNKKKVKEESDYDSEFSEVIRRDRNIKKYEKEINKTIEDAVLPDKKTYELVKGIDTAYGTDYLDAYKRIAARDMTNRGKYIKYAELPGNKNAKISRVRDVQDYGPVVDDYVITIDPLQYLPGTANHELGHLADQLASDANNRYLTYLLDEGNIMGPGELRNKGININPNMQAYLLDPSESKSHMLHLKRALVNEGKIHDWSSKVNQNTIEDFLFDPRNTGVVNNANKLQYNMYRNKSRFVDRINNLTPMEFITPLLLPVAGYEINKE